MGAVQKVGRFDFMGLEPEKAVADAVPLFFVIAALVLLFFAVVGRARQVRD